MKKILVIDDSPDIRRLVTEALERKGFHLVAAEDGAAGIALAKTFMPDLILCDVRMPRLDGYGALKELRSTPATATIPFIFLTAVSDKVNVRQGMEMGADDYLTKPFTLGELVAAVETRLSKQAAWARHADEKLAELRDSITLALPHELITPLNGILGFASLLADSARPFSDAEVRELAGTIKQSAQRLQHLVENFLLYSQLQVVAADPERAAGFRCTPLMPIAHIARETAAEFARFHGRSSDLRTEIHDFTWPVAGDMLGKMVAELTDNAFKFSTPGTPVSIRTRQSPSETALTVENHGRGLAPEQIARIGAHIQFDRPEHEQQGAGLGLAIVKRLAELYGGSLSIQSTPGGATLLSVAFPHPADKSSP